MKLKWPNVLRVARWEFWKGARSPMFLFMTFLLPVIMIVAGGAGFLAEQLERDRPMKLGVYEAEGQFSQYLAEAAFPDNIVFAETSGDEAKLQGLLDDGTLDGYLKVTQEGLDAGQLQLYAADMRQVHPNLLRDLLQPPLVQYRLDELGLDSQLVLEATKPLDLQVQELKNGEAADMSLAGMFVPLAVAMVLIMSALLSGQMLMYGVIKEKRNRVVEILLSSLSSADLLMGKVLGVGGLSLLQILLWVVVAAVIGGRFIDLRTLNISLLDLAPSLVIFFFGFFLLASMFAALGATMKEAEESSQAQGLVVLIPVAPMFASGILMTNPDALWAVIFSHVPPFIPTMMLLRMAATNLPVWQIVSSMTALLLSIALFVFLGARIFERGILQYDKAMGVKDIAAAVRR